MLVCVRVCEAVVNSVHCRVLRQSRQSRVQRLPPLSRCLQRKVIQRKRGESQDDVFLMVPYAATN